MQSNYQRLREQNSEETSSEEALDLRRVRFVCNRIETDGYQSKAFLQLCASHNIEIGEIVALT